MFLFFRELLHNIYISICDLYILTKLQKNNPTCKFYGGSKITNSLFGYYNIVFNDVLIDSCIVGDHTYIQKKTTIFNATIGKYCSIASGVSIGPGIHKIDGISTHPIFYLFNTPLIKKYSNKDLFVSSEKTIIGHDVWIGERAILIDGVVVGTGAIIAAGSVVTKNVAPYSVVGGVPAKVLKYRFNEKEIDFLLKSEWWNNSEEWFEKNYHLFTSTTQFFEKK